jgi:hypothetical protein
MSNLSNSVLAVCAVAILAALAFITKAQAQRPPDIDPTGAAYLRVNINPTDVPPMVNINPEGAVPRIDVVHIPEIHMPPVGCQNRQNFQTGIGRSVVGPLVVTYLHLPPTETTLTLNDGSGGHSMNLGQAGQITTAIFLRAGQSLEFNSDVMYSGCQPE